MYSKLLCASLFGLDSQETWVEVDIDNGMPGFSVVGLANQSIKEAKERIHSAIGNCGYKFPQKRITVNLTPANRKKEGSHYDLAIALAVLISSDLVKPVSEEELSSTAFLGELSLDGRIMSVDGALPMIIGMQKRGVKRVYIPGGNLQEAMLVEGIELIPAGSLKDVADDLNDFDRLKRIKAGTRPSGECADYLDFSDIRGQEFVKRAAQVAAAGMHGMLMIGSPGVGKSMVGKRIPGILSPLSYQEQLEITQIYSSAGELNGKKLISGRPFRAPHHSMSAASLIGGGNIPRPGEVSLAHNGVLFLDELPEFAAHTLDMLRQPLEDGSVSITRVNGKVNYPARFMLVAAMNPCRCGYYGDPVKQCRCTATERLKYVGRISGPLLDRIDVHVVMERIVYDDIAQRSAQKTISTAELRNGVLSAKSMQDERYKNDDISYNSQLTPQLIKKYCALDNECEEIMQRAFSSLMLSARSYHRILKVSRSIADLSGHSEIKSEDILEALSYRLPERFFK